MRKASHQWPTDGATKKYVDRASDKQQYQIERLKDQHSRLIVRMLALEEQIARWHISEGNRVMKNWKEGEEER